MAAPTASSSSLWNSPDIIVQSSDGRQFPVHMKILSVVSSVFEGMYCLPQPRAEAEELPVVVLAEDGETIQVLMDAIYPERYPSTQLRLSTLSKVAAAAQKYEMACVMSFVAHCLQSTRYLDQPLQLYAIACRHSLNDIAAAAAEASLLHPWPTALPAEFAEISAVWYHKLLTFRKRCESVFDSYLDSESCQTYEEYARLWSSLPMCSRCPQGSYWPDRGPPVVVGPAWFIAHLHLAKQEFTRRIDGSSVMSLSLLNDTMRALREGRSYSKCDCVSLGPTRLAEFSQLSANIINRMLSKIHFTVEGIVEDEEPHEDFTVDEMVADEADEF